MKQILLLGVTAAFLGGLATGLLASYPVEENSIYVCFVALFIGLAAALLGAWSMLLEATKRERVRVDRVVDLTIDALNERGLEIVRDRR